MNSVEKTDDERAYRVVPARPGFVERLKLYPTRVRDFYKEVRDEMKKVSWPSRQEVTGTSIVVIVAVFFFGVYLFLVDSLLQRGLGWVLEYFKTTGG